MMTTPTGIDAAKSHTYRSIEVCAKDVREVLGLAADEPADMHEIFEFRIDDFLVGSGTVRAPMVHGVEDITTEALTRWNCDEERIELILSGEWYRALCIGHARARFTVAHELGHAVMHTKTLVALGDLSLQSQAALHRGLKDHPIHRDTEWQANSFAAAFLMPLDGIQLLRQSRGGASIAKLSARFGVSNEAAAVRLNVLERGKLNGL